MFINSIRSAYTNHVDRSAEHEVEDCDSRPRVDKRVESSQNQNVLLSR